MIERTIQIPLPTQVIKEVKVYLAKGDKLMEVLIEQNVTPLLVGLHNQGALNMFEDDIDFEFVEDQGLEPGTSRRVKVTAKLRDHQGENVVSVNEELYLVKAAFDNHN